MEVADGMVRECLHNHDVAVDLKLMGKAPRPGELLPIARGLLERALVTPVHPSDALSIDGRPIVNDRFGVPKDPKRVGTTQGLASWKFIASS